MFKTHEGQELAAYSLDVEGIPGWVLQNQLFHVLYQGGLGAQTRTMHEIKNYENALGGQLVSFIS